MRKMIENEITNESGADRARAVGGGRRARSGRGLVSLVLVTLLAAAGGGAPAQAAPRGERSGELAAIGRLDDIGLGKPTKRTRKDREIERHEWMAQYYVSVGNDLPAAVKEYQAVLRLDKKRVSAALALSSLYQRTGKPKPAQKTLQGLAKANPKVPQVWLALAELQGAQGDKKGQASSIAKAVELAPRDPSVVAARFAAAHQRFRGGDGDSKDELLAAARAYVSSPRQLGPYQTLAQRTILELADDPVALLVFDAKAAYAEAFDSARMTDINAKMAEAKRGFEGCVAKQPANQECHYHLGLVYSSVKASDAYDPKKALEELAKAPDLALAGVATARIYRSRDQNAPARAALEKVLAKHRGLEVALVELAILDKLEGKDDDAVKRLEEAVEQGTDRASRDRAVTELSKIRPTHPLVQASLMGGDQGDVFSSERFKAAVALVEEAMGGVEKNAPELAAIEDIVMRLATAAGVGSSLNLKVAVLATDAVNALAMPNGSVYVTRGMFDFLKKMWPNRPIDAKHDALGHVLAHELAHVWRRHTMQGVIYREAIKDASAALDPSVLTHVTRLQEIEADREGIVMAVLAGFHPRGGIELMEKLGKEHEIPPHLDHPTFEERVSFLQEYWTNDVRYAYVSFGLGVGAMEKAAKLEDSDLAGAVAAYELAAEHFKRFRTTLTAQRDVMNNLGVVYAKLGVLALGKSDTPLGRWRTRFSIEKQSAAKYAGLMREEEEANEKRSSAPGKARMPWQLREAISMFREALAGSEGYSKARLNLATACLAGGRLDEAGEAIALAKPGRGVSAGDLEIVRGVIAAEKGEADKAQRAFEAAAKAGNAAAASYNLARLLEVRGKKAEAKAAYESYAKAYPSGPWTAAAKAAAAKL
jgi:predicted Zn-dependent protease